jgi:hypothetical protein
MTFSLLTACGGKKEQEAKPESKAVVKMGAVAYTAHPASLEGKTVVLRWNGKYNGDKLLSKVAELLTRSVKDIKVVKMWEVDKATAVISDSMENSLAIVKKIADQKPAMVIASQAD